MSAHPLGAVPLLPWLQAPLEQALAQQRGHALLVHGPSGVGQFEFAHALAGAWLCESPLARQACGHCAGCRLMQSRTHPDFNLLMPEAVRVAMGWGEEEARDSEGKKAKPSKELKVEAVREAISWTQTSASRGIGKVVLIHPAQAMNAVSANALLKTLEEPPSGVRLLLTAHDPEVLLPTIRSRCQRWALALPPHEQALQWLAGLGVVEPAVLLDAAGGRPLDAALLHAEDITAANWRALPKAVARGDARPLAGWSVPRVVDTLQKLCHDAMVAAAGGTPRYFPADALPQGASIEGLAAWGRSLNRTARHDEHPWNAGLLTEALVLEGALAWPALSPVTNGKRLATLNAR
jgi:DNA polymerase III subunit delta'